MRRGFKADAERHAAQLREALGCSDRESIPLHRLATYLKVAVLAGDKVLQTTSAVEPFQALHDEQRGAFSAATFVLPDGRTVVIYNPITYDGVHLGPEEARRDGRTRSNIAHEFAHLVLGHELREVEQIAGHSFFTCNPTQEEEANWLAGCLLLPRRLLLDAARQGHPDSALVETHHVTEDMVRFRMNTSGVRMQVARGRGTARR